MNMDNIVCYCYVQDGDTGLVSRQLFTLTQLCMNMDNIVCYCYVQEGDTEPVSQQLFTLTQTNSVNILWLVPQAKDGYTIVYKI